MSSAVIKYQGNATAQARIDKRAGAERILTLARHLRRPEYRRAMVLRYRDGWELGDIATDLGVDRRAAAKIMARLERLVQCREYLLMSVGLSQVPAGLHKVGEHIYLRAMTLDETAEATGKSLFVVRQQKREIEGIAIGAIGLEAPTYRGRRNTVRQNVPKEQV